MNYIAEIRQQNPLIHNITNMVVANYSANGLLALGASPIMSSAPEEMEHLAQLCQALVINIGTLNVAQVEAMLIAGKAANKNGIPVVLDPVGVGATPFRRQTVQRLLDNIQFSAIRGNAGEIATLANVDWQAKGVDAGEGKADWHTVAKTVANANGCVVSISGEVDYVSDGKQVVTIHNGTPIFPKITGSGCLLSAVCGAFLAVEKTSQNLTALVRACTAYAVAGERVMQGISSTQTGQFAIQLLDQLAILDDETVEQYGRVNYV
ncbi:hydroxyethylthiazole kinase [Conservatibacter flavescens]|uniref:Hydroxyethylthiazole kinase n=1 Tax=Conservatibacter flavescens TaxID=28161 RepID=A0A2M8S4H4_9PAST|nr:hydroxyethylthiazole kinase [Conservatibacter flavescens]PJG86034.1 hydroxyethylthiazole kinase [Conservatibacter flavescens]